MVAELYPVAVDPADGVVLTTVERGDGGAGMVVSLLLGRREYGQDLRSKDTGKEVANHTANAVDGKDIKAIVNAQNKLELSSKVTKDTTANTNNDSCPGFDEASSRCDGDEARDDTRAEADSAPFLLKTEIEKNPGNTTTASSKVGDVTGHDSADVHGENGTAVEAEPTDP